MYLLTSLAERIVKEVSEVLNEEIIVINEKAIIVAATDSSRVGDFHEIAAAVLEKGDKKVISPNEAKYFSNVRAGITLPIAFREKNVGVVGITGREEKIGNYATLIQRMTELIIEQVYAAEITSLKWRSLEGILSEVIRSKEITPNIESRASLLGLEIEKSYSIILLEYRGKSDREPPYPSFLGHSLITKWGNNQFILLIPTENIKSIKHIIDRVSEYLKFYSILVTKIGVSSSRTTLSNSYKEAEVALSYSHQNIVFYEELSIELILRDLSDRTREKILQDTKSIHQDQLLETLQMYFQKDLSIKNTSKELHIHVNTLQYRLKKIYELTGFNYKKLPDLFILYIAVSEFLYETTK